MALFHPSRQVIPVKTRIKCIYLIDIDTRLPEKLLSEGKIIQTYNYFYYAAKILHFRNKTKC